MPRRVQFEYSVIIEADEYDDIQHQHLSEELEAYFNTYDNNITLGEYQFKIHKLPEELVNETH